jgi:glycine betaine/proline transport system substrate-binding protein
MMLRFCFSLLLSVYSFTSLACEKVIFGDLDWDSSRFHVGVASFIVKNGYGCEVDRIPGTTTPMLTALGGGDIHILMEVWKQNIEDAWALLEKENKVTDLGINFPDAIQGWFVPRYLVFGDQSREIEPIAPNLKSVDDLIAHKKLFIELENPKKGRFYNCMLGWACEDVNTKKLEAYNLLNDFENFRPGTSSALASVIASKYKQGKPFVAYYWGPTWVLGTYDLIKLKEPAFDPIIWEKLTSGSDLSQAVEYPVVPVNIGVNTKWAKKNKELVEFLKKYEMAPGQTSDALSFMQKQKGRTPNDAALNFLKTNIKVWKNWVTPEAYKKVKKALDNNITKNKSKSSMTIAETINDSVSWLVTNYGESFRRSTLPVLKLIMFTEKTLLSLPWWVLSIFVSLFAIYLKRFKLSIGLFACFSCIYFLGLWVLSMQTLALMMISTLVSSILGLPLGILSAGNKRFRSVLLPILDAMQTMPSFVYLIPALMLFGLGKVPAVFATVIYAIVPTIRLTDLGIRKVDPFTVEAATSFGATPWQLLTKVKLPLALPSIMAGINQTIMMALSMVVISSMIGSRGLGEQVLLGIQKLDVGQGFIAGVGIVLLAIIIDRLTQSIGQKLDKSINH